MLNRYGSLLLEMDIDKLMRIMKMDKSKRAKVQTESKKIKLPQIPFVKENLNSPLASNKKST